MEIKIGAIFLCSATSKSDQESPEPMERESVSDDVGNTSLNDSVTMKDDSVFEESYKREEEQEGEESSRSTDTLEISFFEELKVMLEIQFQ